MKVYHWATCWLRRRWIRRKWGTPFWREDRVAQMLGVAYFGCPRCGRGAIEQRDAQGGTCPTVCVETHHPGGEHEAWVSDGAGETRAGR